MLFRARTKSWIRRLQAFFWPRKGIKRGWIYLVLRVLRLRSTNYALAAGFASGVFASFTPLLGAHVLIACAVAWIVRGNMLMAVIGTVVGNPWTFPLIWGLIHAVGSLIIGQDPILEDVSGLTYATFVEEPGAVLISMIVGGFVTGGFFALLIFLLGYHYALYIRKQMTKLKENRLNLLKAKKRAGGKTSA